MQAFAGADYLFLVTDFATSNTYEGEVQQGQNAVDAAKEVWHSKLLGHASTHIGESSFWIHSLGSMSDVLHVIPCYPDACEIGLWPIR